MEKRTASPMKPWIKDPSSGYLYAGVFGFFAGVAIELLFQCGPAASVAAGLAAFVLVFILRDRKILILSFLFLSFFALGILRTTYEDRMLGAYPVGAPAGLLSIEGEVIRDPEIREQSLHVVIKARRPQESAGKNILLVLDRAEDVSYGDVLKLQGSIKEPESFETDQGRIFNYPQYLRAKGIIAVSYRPSLVEKQEGGFSLFGILYAGKNAFEWAIDSVFTEPEGGFLKGILLGNRDSLPKDVREDFIAVGLIHIVVLSGYNITLLAEWIMKLLESLRARKKVAYVVAAFSIIAFVVMTGADETAVRAGIMGLLLILARFLRRPQDLPRALALAAFLMVTWNPLVLLWSPSFALSFLATLGLIFLSPYFEKVFWFVTGKGGVRGILAATLGTQIFVLPYILWMSGVVSPISVLLNLLVLPLIPLAMIAGFFTALIAFVSTTLALIPAFCVSAVLSFVIYVAGLGASLPLSSFVIPAFPWWGSAFLYTGLLTLLLYRTHIGRKKNAPANYSNP